jgi:hypothetical protein
MTPDDLIPDQYNTQSLNRFTYVENGPLSYTDPTGHDVSNAQYATPAAHQLANEQADAANLEKEANNNPNADIEILDPGLANVEGGRQNAARREGRAESESTGPRAAARSSQNAPSNGTDPHDWGATSDIGGVTQQMLKVAWEYHQRTGQLTDDNGNAVGNGYSGNGDGLNNPDAEDQAYVGPIPQGGYTIQQQQNNVTGSGTSLPASERLVPDAGNNMHGRDGFLIHGDNQHLNHTASDGCVILPRSVRNQIGSSNDHHLTVVP